MTFGKNIKGYEVPVFNKREIRASAGILFLLAIIAFFNDLLAKNYFPLKIFIMTYSPT